MLAEASAVSALPMRFSQSSKSFHAWPHVEVTYTPAFMPVSIANVVQVQVSFWLLWNCMCFFRPCSNCASEPSLGLTKYMRQTLEAFWALMACVEELAELAWAQQPVAQIKLIARTALPDFMMFSPGELNSRCAPYLFRQNMSRNIVRAAW